MIASVGVTIEGDLRKIMAEHLDDAKRAVTRGIGKASEGLKTELRQQVTGGGMSQRLANTWREKVYPDRPGVFSLRAAALVFSRAPLIVDAFDRGVTIVPIRGSRYLAIPTKAVPRRKAGEGTKGRYYMSPVEVEAHFNQDLKFAKAGNGRLVAYVDVIGSKSGKGFRRATPKRLAAGRTTASVVMFVMIPQAQLKKRFDIDGAAQRWRSRLPDLIVQSWPEARR